MSKFNKIMKYNQYHCRCICVNCSDSVFIQLKAYLVKDDYFSQGFCKNCDSWRLESEINECEHCQEVRKFDMEGIKK